MASKTKTCKQLCVSFGLFTLRLIFSIFLRHYLSMNTTLYLNINFSNDIKKCNLDGPFYIRGINCTSGVRNIISLHKTVISLHDAF